MIGRQGNFNRLKSPEQKQSQREGYAAQVIKKAVSVPSIRSAPLPPSLPSCPDKSKGRMQPRRSRLDLPGDCIKVYMLLSFYQTSHS